MALDNVSQNTAREQISCKAETVGKVKFDLTEVKHKDCEVTKNLTDVTVNIIVKYAGQFVQGVRLFYTWPECQLSSLNFFVSILKHHSNASDEYKTFPIWRQEE